MLGEEKERSIVKLCAKQKDRPIWSSCICCLRRWEEESLEFEYCPECLQMVKETVAIKGYDQITLSQRLKYCEFKDPELAECLRLFWKIYEHNHD